jgi:hypothetical protein
VKYDGAEFLQRVRAHQLHERGRTSPTGCWVCDVLEAEHGFTQRRCERISGGVVDAHHLLPKQVLKREAPRGIVMFDGAWVWPEVMEAHVNEEGRGNYRRRKLDDLLMDPRNGILVRRYHHDQLERRLRAIPLDKMPADALEFADELGLRWWLENQESRRGVA